MHTAEHLLNQTLFRMFGCERSRNAHIERKKSKISWPLSESPTEKQVQEIEHRINELIAAALPVTYEFCTYNRLPLEVDTGKLPENASEMVRLVRIGDYDVCACIGTHVNNTREIGEFKINSWRYQDGVFRIVFKVMSSSVSS
jgi:alanyl-tRNA synthetase